MTYLDGFQRSVKRVDGSFDGSLTEGFREKCLIHSIFNTYIYLSTNVNTTPGGGPKTTPKTPLTLNGVSHVTNGQFRPVRLVQKKENE